MPCPMETMAFVRPQKFMMSMLMSASVFSSGHSGCSA